MTSFWLGIGALVLPVAAVVIAHRWAARRIADDATCPPRDFLGGDHPDDTDNESCDCTPREDCIRHRPLPYRKPL